MCLQMSRKATKSAASFQTTSSIIKTYSLYGRSIFLTLHTDRREDIQDELANFVAFAML